MLKKFMLLAGGFALAGTATAAAISGAGATFPAPIYTAWASAYQAQTGQQLNFQAIGSGGGIKQIEAKTVDFGATDKPLKPEDLAKYGLYQFPTVIGGIVPIINLQGLNAGRLKLDGRILGDIYLGKIKQWNDPEIQKVNPQLKLPDVAITVVHRSDGSGTSFNFTSFLSATNPEWASRVGASDSVNWPTGLGGKGNDGVSAFVKQTVGSIGYVEYAFAKQNHAAYALVCNKTGHCPQPVAASFAAAAAGARWDQAPGNYLLLFNQPGANSWPITAATFILVYKDQSNPEAGQSVLKFFDWAYKNGDAAAAKLDYVPLPANVKTLIRHQWAQNITAGGKPVYVSK
jgi:phosphate transport system substrate-binding protein